MNFGPLLWVWWHEYHIILVNYVRFLSIMNIKGMRNRQSITVSHLGIRILTRALNVVYSYTLYKHLYRALVWIILGYCRKKKNEITERQNVINNISTKKSKYLILLVWFYQVKFTTVCRILANQDCGEGGLSILRSRQINSKSIDQIDM